MEFGSEDNNTVERKTYARFTTALPLSDHESMTNFSISKKALTKVRQVLLMDLCLSRLLPPSIRDGAEVI
jgi:hypothetical protein